MIKKWFFSSVVFSFLVLPSIHSEVLAPQAPLPQDIQENQEDAYYGQNPYDDLAKDTRSLDLKFDRFEVKDNMIQVLDVSATVDDKPAAKQTFTTRIFFYRPSLATQKVEFGPEFSGFPLVITGRQQATDGVLGFPARLLLDNPMSQTQIEHMIPIMNEQRSPPPENVKVDVQNWETDEQGRIVQGSIVYEEDSKDLPNISKFRWIANISQSEVTFKLGLQGNFDVLFQDNEKPLIDLLTELKDKNPKTVGEAAVIINKHVEKEINAEKAQQQNTDQEVPSDLLNF